MDFGLVDALMRLSPAEFQWLVLLLVAVLAYLLYRLFRHYRRYRLIADTPSSRIASAAQGLVELQGLAEWMPGDRILSPFSGERCVWYHCRIERRKRLHNRSHWVEDLDRVSDEPFRLVDDSGECVVDPSDARVLSRHHRRWYGSRIGQSRQPELSRYTLGLSLNPRYRFSETLIRVADPVHVVGEFTTLRQEMPAEDEENRIDEIVAEWRKHPARYLKGFDLDGDHRIAGDEWNLVRERARQLLQESRGPAVNVIRKPGDNRQPFLISAFDEEGLLQRHRRGMLWSFLGFLFLLYLLLFALQLRP